MIIVDVKNGESIDQALKRLKRKYRDTKIIKELRERKEFVKPSVRKRNKLLKAIYKERRLRQMDQ